MSLVGKFNDRRQSMWPEGMTGGSKRKSETVLTNLLPCRIPSCKAPAEEIGGFCWEAPSFWSKGQRLDDVAEKLKKDCNCLL